MRSLSLRFWMVLMVLLGCLALGCQQQGENDLDLEKIPEVVMDALKARFPRAEIRKWTREKEGDIVIYDFEFEQVGQKFEADIKEDGTIHNWEKAIQDKDLPEAARTSVEKKYPKAAIREIMAISAVKDGKDALEGYEIVLETTDGKDSEVTVSPEGKILEDSAEKKPE